MASFDFEQLNHTELYQSCRLAGLNPKPDMTKTELITLLQREEDDPLEKNVFDELRESIFVFVDEYWEVLRSQITCPAKERHIRACHGCVDAQVLKCVTSVPAMDRFIKLRRK